MNTLTKFLLPTSDRGDVWQPVAAAVTAVTTILLQPLRLRSPWRTRSSRPRRSRASAFAATASPKGAPMRPASSSSVSDRTVEFFLGEGANRLIIGSATVAQAANNGVATIGLKDLREVQTAAAPFLDNVISLLVSLDANSDASDGISIDAATNAAIATAIAGKTLDFGKAADAFKTDPVIVALFGALNRTFLDARTAVADFSTLFSQSRSSSIAITGDNSLRGRRQSPEELRLHHPRPRAERCGRRGVAGRACSREGTALRGHQPGRQARLRDQLPSAVR